MDNPNFISIDSLANDPKFEFIKSLNRNSLDENEDDFNDIFGSPYDDIILNCNYFDETEFCSSRINSNELSLLTLNIHSLPSKFSELNDLIYLLSQSNCTPDVICLQELWQFPN